AEDGIRDKLVTGVQTCALPISYKTAWRMFKQIRMLLVEDVTLEGSSVEMDETLIGGRRRKRTMYDPQNKTWVAGIVERKGERRRSEERRVGKESRTRRWRMK